MNIDHDEIMRRVAAIAPVLARNARACDAARQVVPESIAAMMAAGMFRISQPARNGGYELSLRTLADAVTALSQACPVQRMGPDGRRGASLVHGVVSRRRARTRCSAMVATLLIAGTLSWQGSAVAVDGGYRVDGRWQFGSGVDHCQWVMLGCADPRHARARRCTWWRAAMKSRSTTPGT